VNQAATERMIQFGRELQSLNEQLCREYGKNATHKKMLQVRGRAREGAHVMPGLGCSICWSQLKFWLQEEYS